MCFTEAGRNKRKGTCHNRLFPKKLFFLGVLLCCFQPAKIKIIKNLIKALQYGFCHSLPLKSSITSSFVFALTRFSRKALLLKNLHNLAISISILVDCLTGAATRHNI